MGWFDDQISQRQQADQEMFEDAMGAIAGAVMGQRLSAALNSRQQIAQGALDEILRYFHKKPIPDRAIPSNVQDMETALEYTMRPNGILWRPVSLSPGWYRDAVGPMLGTRTDDGTAVALIPSGLAGYTFYDTAAGRRRRVSPRTEGLLDREAVTFYQSFPLRAMKRADLLRFAWRSVSRWDFLLFLASALAVAAVGLLVPYLNAYLFSHVAVSQSTQALLATATFLLCASLGGLLFGMVRQLLLSRICTRMDTSLEAAMMARLLSLPTAFFKRFSAGELANRVQHITLLVEDLVNTGLSTGVTALFSLLYLPQIALFAPALARPALTVIQITAAVTLSAALLQVRLNRDRMDAASRENGIGYALISGIEKIRKTGAEQRAFAQWGKVYAQEAALLYNPPLFLKTHTVLTKAAALAGALWMYAAAFRSGVEIGQYYAFTAAYGMASGAFAALSTAALSAARILPVLDMVRPILETEPEITEEKRLVQKLSGSIELSNVTFRYQETMPPVLDNLSLRIAPNQYVAIVGASGCGKSTLLRILLGFETPQKGAVYYDRQDITRLDMKSLRRKIGVVIQNGRLFTGDIYSNIVISAPWLTLKEAWEAADMAGMREDIEAMPMGMHTLISEGGGGISGGQRQRLMIARAIAPRPKILMFDEATSALDNLTQQRVAKSLDKLKCTRIVIAHRLSTVKQCDRILVMDKGRIVEDGTYEKLIAQEGVFARLVARQMLEDSAIGKSTIY